MLSLLSPAALWLGLLAAPLVALWLLRVRRRRVRVSSLLPWHALRQSEQLASPLQRLRRWWLLLLQLLLLAALVLALARPFTEGELGSYRSLVIVIDRSASMGATDEAPSRFERARAEARSLVSSLGDADEVMIVAAGEPTEVAVPFTRDRAVALRGLDALRVGEAAGHLDQGLVLALSLAKSRPDVQVVVLSDGGGGPVEVVAPSNVPVRLVPIGKSESNAGLVALDLRRSPTAEALRQLFVTAQAFGSDAMGATVEVHLDGQLLAVRNETLPPDEPVSLVFDLPAQAEGVVEVRLHAEPDHLAADDRAFAVLSPPGARRVLLVGGDHLLARILTLDSRIRADQISAAAANRTIVANYDATIFAGPLPDGLDGLDYAVLGPWSGSPVRFGPEGAGPRVTSWQRTHPLLRYTGWDDVVVAKSRPVLDPAGLRVIVDSDLGGLVLAGQRAGGKVVQLAFDPLASDVPLRATWPVFVLNVVGWLTADAIGSESSALHTGEPWVHRLADPTIERATLRGPSGQASVQDGVLRVTGLDRVGVYEVFAGERFSFAANLGSPGESRIRPVTELVLAGSTGLATSDATALQRHEGWRWIVVVALALLALEWTAWSARRVA